MTLSGGIYRAGAPGVRVFQDLKGSNYAPYLNDEFGAEMAQEAGFSGTPEEIHDGNDTALWAGSEVVGSSMDFSSTTRWNTGAQSVYFNRCAAGDITQFANGADIDLNGYIALDLHININNNWSPGGDSFSLYAWDTDLGVQVGNKVYIEDYIVVSNEDEWLPMIVPLSDMGIDTATTVDAFRFECESVSGTAPRWFMDDFKIQETGTIIEYEARPDPDTVFEAQALQITLVCPDGLTDYFNPLKFGGVAKLQNGINYQRFSDGKVAFNFSTQYLFDFCNVGLALRNEAHTGTSGPVTQLLQYRVQFSEPAILDSEKGDYGLIRIQDSLNTFNKVRAALIGSERPPQFIGS